MNMLKSASAYVVHDKRAHCIENDEFKIIKTKTNCHCILHTQ